MSARWRSRKPSLSRFHGNSGTDSKAPWREVQHTARRRPRRSANREPSHFNGYRELVHFPRQALPRISEKVPLRCDPWGTWGLDRVLASRGILPGAGVSATLPGSWATCSPGHAAPRGALGEGKGTNSPTATHSSVRLGRGGQRLLSFSGS